MQAHTIQPPAAPAAAGRPRPGPFWTGLILVAGSPRLLAALLLPNAFGDAYSYLEAVEAMRAKMAGGTFSVADLYGFWLPLYQLVCAALSAVCGHPFYVSKLVAAACGTGVCLLVYQTTLRLTANRLLSLSAFAAVALSPLHVLYSASSLTDVPHALPVTASLYLALTKRWKAAAVCAAAAGLMRVESWMLVALLPALQFFAERRVSLTACGLLTAAPALWLLICWQATGDPLAYFAARNRYVAEYTAANPVVTTFTAARLRLDAVRLLASTTWPVLAGCLAGAGVLFRRLVRQPFEGASLNLLAVVAACGFFFSNSGFLILAYFTGNQPDIWTRYGLILFALGLPILAWAFQAVGRGRPRRAPLVAGALLAAFAWQARTQVAEVTNCVSDESARVVVAGHLREAYRQHPDRRIVCEDGNVRFLSGLPPERFISPAGLPAEAGEVLHRLRAEGVTHVVCTNWEASTLTRLFPELSRGAGGETFRLVNQVASPPSGLKFWVYRFDGGARAEK
jgi:hypothetical protein